LANMRQSPDGKTNWGYNGQKSRRFIIAINLEPHLHFSKNHWPAKLPSANFRQTRVSQPFDKLRVG
jgi:hypothetical protein